MVCSVAGFSIDTFYVDRFPRIVGCDPSLGNMPEGCLKPGDTVRLYATVMNDSDDNTPCTCATIKFFANGVEIAKKELCVTVQNIGGYKYYWAGFSFLETEVIYTIPAWGDYNFCAEVVSVR